jgi:hypothetical protein
MDQASTRNENLSQTYTTSYPPIDPEQLEPIVPNVQLPSQKRRELGRKLVAEFNSRKQKEKEDEQLAGQAESAGN